MKACGSYIVTEIQLAEAGEDERRLFQAISIVQAQGDGDRPRLVENQG